MAEACQAKDQEAYFKKLTVNKWQTVLLTINSHFDAGGGHSLVLDLVLLPQVRVSCNDFSVKL